MGTKGLTVTTLEVGKIADIVVLERDPYTSDPHSIHTIKVDYTFSDGRLVFSRASPVSSE